MARGLQGNCWSFRQHPGERNQRPLSMHIDRQNSQEGSSLIEVMVATIVSLVLIGAVLSTVIQQGHQRQATAESSLARSPAWR